MAAIGTNMQVGTTSRIWSAILKKLGFGLGTRPKKSRRPLSTGTTAGRQIAILLKTGAPATNTAADAPTGVGDLCWDSTNKDLYLCSAYTNTTTFTWGKIID